MQIEAVVVRTTASSSTGSSLSLPMKTKRPSAFANAGTSPASKPIASDPAKGNSAKGPASTMASSNSNSTAGPCRWMPISCCLAAPGLQQENQVFCHTRHFEIGVRVIPQCFQGYVPIGFFQMWNPSVSGIHTYPEQHTSAARGDVAFAIQWPRAKRALIPEIICYHLESEQAPMGTNWNGRTTKPFAPNPSVGQKNDSAYESPW